MTCRLDTEGERFSHRHMPLLPFHMIYNEDGRRHTESVNAKSSRYDVSRRHTRCFRRLHLLQASDTRAFGGAEAGGPEVVAIGEFDAITSSMLACPAPEVDPEFVIVTDFQIILLGVGRI